jgi:hypothetical protein
MTDNLCEIFRHVTLRLTNANTWGTAKLGNSCDDRNQ